MLAGPIAAHSRTAPGRATGTHGRSASASHTQPDWTGMSRSNPSAGRTVVIGIDGVSYDVLRHYVESGVLPFLQSVARKGAFWHTPGPRLARREPVGFSEGFGIVDLGPEETPSYTYATTIGSPRPDLGQAAVAGEFDVSSARRFRLAPLGASVP